MTEPPSKTPPAAIEYQADAGFKQILSNLNGSLLLTTYQAGKVFLLSGVDGELVASLAPLPRPMGVAALGNVLAIASLHSIWMFAEAKGLAAEYARSQNSSCDAVYLPRSVCLIGQSNIHDLAFDSTGTLWMTATRFSCLAKVHPSFTFVPAWKPPFITAFAPEDRCHLNGMAFNNGQPAYATAFSETNTPTGWRALRDDGAIRTSGVLLDVASGKTVLRGLCMPHSPKVLDHHVWLLNSGAGELLRFDPATSAAETICVLPGYLRGLALVPPLAIVGLCPMRDTSFDMNVPVRQKFPELFSGIAFVNLNSGNIVGTLRFLSAGLETYDIAFLPRFRHVRLCTLETNFTQCAVTTPQHGIMVPKLEIAR